MTPHEIALRKAQALAGMDRLDEALRVVEPFGDGKAVPGWFYRSMLAQVYEFARRRDEAIAQLEQAIELAPDNATLMISLARHVIWYKRDVRRARELLTQARLHALSDMTKPFADLVEGIILLEEGRPRDALPSLETVHKIFHARRHMPMGYLPVEQAMLGRALPTPHSARVTRRRSSTARSAHALWRDGTSWSTAATGRSAYRETNRPAGCPGSAETPREVIGTVHLQESSRAVSFNLFPTRDNDGPGPPC